MASKDEAVALLQKVRERLERQLEHISSMIHGSKELRTELLYRQTEAVRRAFQELEQFMNTNLF